MTWSFQGGLPLYILGCAWYLCPLTQINSVKHGSIPLVIWGKQCCPRKRIALGKRESPPELSVEYVTFQSKLGLGSPALHKIVNPWPDSVPDGAGVASLLGVGVVSLSPAIPPVTLSTNGSLLAMLSCCSMSCHAAAIARFLCTCWPQSKCCCTFVACSLLLSLIAVYVLIRHGHC